MSPDIVILPLHVSDVSRAPYRTAFEINWTSPLHELTDSLFSNNDPQLVRTNEAALRPHPHYCQNLPCPRIRSGWGRLFAFGGLNREVGGQSWYLVVNSTSFSPLKPNRTQFSGRPYFRAWVPALVAMESEYESFIGCNNCHRKGEPWLLFTFFIPLLHLWNRKVFFLRSCSSKIRLSIIFTISLLGKKDFLFITDGWAFTHPRICAKSYN